MAEINKGDYVVMVFEDISVGQWIKSSGVVLCRPIQVSREAKSNGVTENTLIRLPVSYFQAAEENVNRAGEDQFSEGCVWSTEDFVGFVIRESGGYIMVEDCGSGVVFKSRTKYFIKQ